MAGKKHNIPMCLAMILLCLTMITTYLTSGLYARYTSTAIGSDSARVAKFEVRAEIRPVENPDNDPNKEGKFTLTVTNASEVAVKYSVVVTFGDWPMTAKIGERNGVPSDDSMTSTFTDLGELVPGAEAEHTLSLDLAQWAGVTNRVNNSGRTEPVNGTFDIDVNAEQID